MDAFDFSRLGVFIVEDNNYVRETLESLLRHFRIGRIAVASNGEEAIDYMKSLGSASSIIAPDIVMSDLVMTPINGLLFLRWMRTAKESSNRMIPYIMLSGAADGAYVIPPATWAQPNSWPSRFRRLRFTSSLSRLSRHRANLSPPPNISAPTAAAKNRIRPARNGD